MLPPLLFQPIMKRIRWGGRRLGSLLQKPIESENDYAESWEIADHADGQSIVATGPLQGRLLSDLMREYRKQLLGCQDHLSQFPLLIKFLDANDWLSLQVHPDDLLAKQFQANENGKTEAWVILEARPDSRICSGLKSGVTVEQLRTALINGTVEECLNIISVKSGDCIFVPAGTVHALGPGIVLAEVQQQSNLTFRLFDWGRVDASGKARPIHVEESITCTDFKRGPVLPVKPIQLCDQSHVFEELVRCEHFVIRRHRFIDPARMMIEDRFRILITLEGAVQVRTKYGSAVMPTGTTALLPACSGETALIPSSPATLLEVLCP
jgi:mannose-6-phosphate isomerase